MEEDINEEFSYDYDENAKIDEDEIDSNVSGENDIRERIRNIPDINLFKLFTRKRKLIQFCFDKIIFLSIIPTLIYNIFWIIKMFQLKFENLVNLIEFKYCILFACFITLIKGIIILFFPLIRCGTGNSLNILVSFVFFKNVYNISLHKIFNWRFGGKIQFI